MSGICGVWALDGDEPELGPVLAELQRRGPDATRHWRNGPVALGHTLLATTPEALVEPLPLSDADSGCTITADVRLDNREELIAALGLACETRTIGDGELVLGAYLKWADDCPNHLLGDFAFAIWDPRQQRLFCARDHMGMRQLIYHSATGRVFAFATDAEALVSHRSVPKRINEERIADYLDDLEAIDFVSTFFEDVYRLPPAHVLTVTSAGPTLRRYWELTPGPKLKLDNDEAYADAFLKVFREAVRCRLRSPGPVGSMLSGGMDSGSVVAVAAELLAAEHREPLRTFSAIAANRPDCIESRAIREASALPGLAPQFVALENVDAADLADFPLGTEPFDSHMTLVRAIYRAAHNSKIRVILDGVAGDVSLTSGNRVAQLLQQGKLLKAMREARGEERFWGASWPSWSVFFRSAWSALVPSTIRDRRRAIIARRANFKDLSHPLIHGDFARRVDLPARREMLRRHVPTGRLSDMELRASAIMHPNLVVARERYDRLASSLGIEPRDPFFDRRVVEFCLSLPSSQLQSAGWPKLILRRAMRGRLPDSVIWRRGKEHLGWAFTEALFAGIPDWQKRILMADGEAAALRPWDRLGIGTSHDRKMLDNETKMKLFYLMNWIVRIHVP